MRRAITFLFLFSVLSAAIVAGAPSSELTVSNVSVEPGTPKEGETIVVEPTIEHQGDESEWIDLDSITLADENGTVLSRIDDPANLSAGKSVTVLLKAAFDDPGTHELRIWATGEDEDGDSFNASQHFVVRVEDRPRARVNITTTKATATVNSELAVAMKNPLDQNIHDVAVVVYDEDGTTIGDRQVASELSAGEAVETSFDYTASSPGTRNFEVVLRYQTATGSSETIRKTDVVTFRRPGQVEITGLDIKYDSRTLTITGSASNIGSTEVEAVTVGVADTDGIERVTPRNGYFIGSVPSSDFVTFDISVTPVADADFDEVTLNVTYFVDDQQQHHLVTVPYDPPTSEREFAIGGNDTLFIVGVAGTGIVAVAALIGTAWRRSRDRS